MSSDLTGGTTVPLPTGTVTFMLADIEGSVRLWEAQPETMPKVLARHDELVGKIVSDHGGARPIEQGEGDSFVSAFSVASDAVSCALAVQLAHSREEWPGESGLRLRMAIHTGDGQIRGGTSYMGSGINRCARLRDIGHGGQTLLSATAETLVRDQLPDRVVLLDLGVHQLRDFLRPERVYQLSHPDLQQEFPPLRSLDWFPNNLPLQLTTFIGREAEKDEVKKLLAETRFLTLIGAGGAGKTRFALELAADLLDKCRDGAWFVDLASIDQPALVPQAVASALGVEEGQGGGLTEILVRRIGSRSELIILDNCEHLVSACAELSDALLRTCPKLRLLATSREPLRVPGEVAWRVAPLSFPSVKQPFSARDLLVFESVQLFVDRAARARPDFEITDENAPAVAEICRVLDGIPLAVELAAARTRVLTPGQIAEGLADRFRLLTGGPRLTEPRHQTLEASVAWSYDLLSESERALFRRLGAFAGGFTLTAVEDVCTEGNHRMEVLDLLSDLVDKSLVQPQQETIEPRYFMLSTIREYARKVLRDSGEERLVRARHFEYFLALATGAEPELTGPDQGIWLDRLEAELDDLREAFRWALAGGRTEPALELAGDLIQFFVRRGRLTEGREWLESATSGGVGAPDPVRWKAVWGKALIEENLGNPDAALSAGEESVSIAQRLGDDRTIARSLELLGSIKALFRDPSGGIALLEESVSIARKLDDLWCLSAALSVLGQMRLVVSDFEGARPLYQESLETARLVGDGRWIVNALQNLAQLDLHSGDFAAAEARFEEELAGALELKDETHTASALSQLGFIAYLRGDYEKAKRLGEEALGRAQDIGSSVLVSGALGLLGGLANAKGFRAEAQPLLERGLDLARGAGYSVFIPWILVQLAEVSLAEDKQAKARTFLEEALSLSRETENKAYVAMSLERLALQARLDGELQQAGARLREALGVRVQSGPLMYVADCLEALAGLAAARGDGEHAARLFGAAHSFWSREEFPRPPGRQTQYERDQALARQAISDGAFDAAFAAGAEMSMAQAVAYASESV